MEYKSLTQAERDATIAEAIHSREVEFFHYDLNAANYQNLLNGMAATPNAWPDELRYLKDRTRDDIIALAKTDADGALALAIMEKDRLRRLMASEQHERAKVDTYHAQLVAQFKTPAELDAALAAARTKREAAEAARLATT